jgi:hypothetical protein
MDSVATLLEIVYVEIVYVGDDKKEEVQTCAHYMFL